MNRRTLIKPLVTAAVSLAVLCSTQPARAVDISDSVYYLESAGGVGSGPLPFDPCGSSVPVIQVAPGVYLVEDVDNHNPPTEATAQASAKAESTSGFPSFGSDGGSGPLPSGGGQNSILRRGCLFVTGFCLYCPVVVSESAQVLVLPSKLMGTPTRKSAV